jgi:hypothetical protein
MPQLPVLNFGHHDSHLMLRVCAVGEHAQAGAAARASLAVAGSIDGLQRQPKVLKQQYMYMRGAHPSPKAMACTVVHRANVASRRPA